MLNFRKRCDVPHFTRRAPFIASAHTGFAFKGCWKLFSSQNPITADTAIWTVEKQYSVATRVIHMLKTSGSIGNGATSQYAQNIKKADNQPW